MQEQVNDDRIRTRHLLNLTEEIIQLKLHLDNEFFHINTIFNHLSSKNYSLENIKQRIYYEFDLEKQNRQVTKKNTKVIKSTFNLFGFFFLSLFIIEIK